MLANANRSTTSASAKAPGWLFVLPWTLRDTGGVNQVVSSLIQCFRDGGEFVPHLLITSRTEKSSETFDVGDLNPTSMDLWSPIDSRHRVRSIFSFAYRWPFRYRELRRLIARYNIAVVNLHFPNLNALMFVVLRRVSRSSLRVVLSFHGSDVKNVLTAGRLERFLWRIVLRGADRIAVVSKSLAAELLELEPRVERQLVTINSGVDLQTFNADGSFKSMRTKAEQRKTIVSIGAFSEIKGHDILVRAFSIVAKRVPGCQLRLVGKRGPELERIRKLISSLQLDEEVRIHTDVPHEHIPTFLSQACLFVLASRREGFPLVLMEAAAARVPIVCTQVGGTNELIVDGVTGKLVRIDDYVALAAGITELLTHPQDAERIATNCYERVRSSLTWNHSYRKYLQLVPRNNHAQHNT
jgi:glycosyltransferase involved in cell wall biosynthesis